MENIVSDSDENVSDHSNQALNSQDNEKRYDIGLLHSAQNNFSYEEIRDSPSSNISADDLTIQEKVEAALIKISEDPGEDKTEAASKTNEGFFYIYNR